MQNTVKILFFGDLVGRPGRRIVKDILSGNVDAAKDISYDFVIANVENASHGFSLSEKNYKELSEAGIHCMTSGNHIWDKKEIFSFIDKADKLLRPINYPPKTAGVGFRIFEFNDIKIGVINVLGTTYMNTIEPYWGRVGAILYRIKKQTPIIIIDFHAEATAEKICFARWASYHKASAIFGTHTHVQTADAQIINGQTAYITDAGFCGGKEGVIGMEFMPSLRKFLTYLPQKHEIASGSVAQASCVLAEIEVATGKAVDIKSFIIEKDYNGVTE